MYDKQGSVLRIETTINNARRFKVRRLLTRQGQPVWANLPMRKGVADMTRRAALCLAVNGRYLQALAVVGQPAPVAEVLDPVSRPLVRQGRPYRALRPVTALETALFRVLLRGANVVHGVRNRDLLPILFPQPTADRHERARRTAKISRWLALFRCHGMIRKVSRTHNYRVTQRGQQVMSTALRLRDIDLCNLAA